MAAKDIPGRAAYLWIYREWIASKPRRGATVVEVGVALGRSIAALCEMLDEENRHDIQVYGVDPWAGTDRNGEQQALAGEAGGDFTLYAQMMLKHAPKAFERVKVIRAHGDEAGKLFDRIGLVDCVVLDGAHNYPTVRREIEDWRWRVIADSGCVIGGDDYKPDEYPGVVKAVDEAFGTRVEVRNEENWPTWRVKL